VVGPFTHAHIGEGPREVDAEERLLLRSIGTTDGELANGSENLEGSQKGDLLGVGLDEAVGNPLHEQQVPHDVEDLIVGAFGRALAGRAHLAIDHVGEADHGEARARQRLPRLREDLLLGAARIAVLVHHDRHGPLAGGGGQGQHELDGPRSREPGATRREIPAQEEAVAPPIGRFPGAANHRGDFASPGDLFGALGLHLRDGDRRRRRGEDLLLDREQVGRNVVGVAHGEAHRESHVLARNRGIRGHRHGVEHVVRERPHAAQRLRVVGPRRRVAGGAKEGGGIEETAPVDAGSAGHDHSVAAAGLERDRRKQEQRV
jgi:hypothetical protein